MALQDLTPQLRTRLSRMERAVGWFVLIAAAALLFGFSYYLYTLADRKGWFTPKYEYQTCLNNAAGIKVGDPVKLMGFNVGQITAITPNKPDDYYGVTITFTIIKPHYGYVWDDSKVKVSSDFLGNRFLEVTKGVAGIPTIDEDTNKTAVAMLKWKAISAAREQVLKEIRSSQPDLERTDSYTFHSSVKSRLAQIAESDRSKYYTNLTAFYWIPPQESPALNERLEALANQVEQALPNILNLTNRLNEVLANTATLTSNLNIVALEARPAVTNLAILTAQINKPGALGEWLLPTNLNTKLDSVLGGADVAMGNVNTNLLTLNQSLANLGDLTSNLNAQVQVNSNILAQISKAVEDADDFVQGLKRHWLLRSAFKTKKTNAPAKPTEPLESPKEKAR
jgi:hypothetical protein